MAGLLLEIEIKYALEIDSRDFVKKLASNGFLQSEVLTEVDTYYSRPDVDYMETVECLRIRQKNDYSEITYKPATTSSSQVIIKPETNVRLSNPEEASPAAVLFDAIGLVRLVTVIKRRRTYRTASEQGLSISIDELENVGTYVEIEVLSDERVIGENLLHRYESLLGFDAQKPEKKPYRDIVMQNMGKIR